MRFVAPVPAVKAAWLRVVVVGTGLFIDKVNSPEVPPAGAGFETSIFAVPAVAISAASTEIVTCVLLTSVYCRSPPFSLTMELLTKPLPLMVKMKVGPPAITMAGFKLVNAGTGFPTVKLSSAEVPPPGVGVKTEIFKILVTDRSPTGIVRLNCVAELKVAARSCPFIRTIEFGLNLLPVKVTGVAGLPTSAEV